MISAVVLIGSGVFSYLNKDTLESTRSDRERDQESLRLSLEQLEGKRTELADTETETKESQG